MMSNQQKNHPLLQQQPKTMLLRRHLPTRRRTPAGDAASTDDKPDDDSKSNEDEAKPAAQEPDVPEKEKPAEEEEEEEEEEEAAAPEPEGTAVKSPEESADVPTTEAEKKDDKPAEAIAEEEAKAKEVEESKDTLGPIPRSKRPVKKGEEHGSLQDTPFDFTQTLGDSPELNETMDNGVAKLLSNDTQGHQNTRSYEDEETTELETITHSPSQLPTAEASDDENNQTITEITMPGLQEPSSGQNTNIAAVEGISTPIESESKAEILDGPQEELIQPRQIDPNLDQNLNQNLNHDLNQDLDLENPDLAASSPATEAQDSTKSSTPGTPHEQGIPGQSARSVREIVAEEPVSVDLAHPTTAHPQPQSQPQQFNTETETETEIETSPRASDSTPTPTHDTHDGHEKSERMESDLPITFARSTASASRSPSIISEDDSETSALSFTAAERLHTQPPDSIDNVNHEQVEAKQSSPGLLQAIPTPDATAHEPKMLETDFDSVLQMSRELPQETKMGSLNPDEQDENSDLSEAESIEDDESTLEEHLQHSATQSRAASPDSSEVAKPTETHVHNEISTDVPHADNSGSTDGKNIEVMDRSDAISRTSSPDGSAADESEVAHRPSSPADSVPIDTHQKDMDTDDDTDDGMGDNVSNLDQQSVASSSPPVHQASDFIADQHDAQKDGVRSEVGEPVVAIHSEPALNLQGAVGETSELEHSASEDDSDDERSEAGSELRPAVDLDNHVDKPDDVKEQHSPTNATSAAIVEDVSDSDEDYSESEHASPKLDARDNNAHWEGSPVEIPAHALDVDSDDEDQSDADHTQHIDKLSSPEPEPTSLLEVTEARRGSESSDEGLPAPHDLPEQASVVTREIEPSDAEDDAVAQAEELDLSDSASEVSMATNTQRESLLHDQPRSHSPNSDLLNTAPESSLPEASITGPNEATPEPRASDNLSTLSSTESAIEQEPKELPVLHEPNELHDADSESEDEAPHKETSSQVSLPRQAISKENDDNSDSASDDELDFAEPSAESMLDAQRTGDFISSETPVIHDIARDQTNPSDPVSLENGLDDKLPEVSDPQSHPRSLPIAESPDDGLDRQFPDTASTDDESDDDSPSSREISPIGVGRISAPYKIEPAAGETDQTRRVRADSTGFGPSSEATSLVGAEDMATRSTIKGPGWDEDDSEEEQTAYDDKFEGPPAVHVPAASSEASRAIGDVPQELEDSSSDDDEPTNDHAAADKSRDKHLPSLERPQQDVSDHVLSEVKTPDTDDTLGSEPKPVQSAEVKPMGLVRPDIKVVDIPSRDKGKAVASIPESPKRSRSTSRSSRPSRTEPPRTFLTQQQRPRRSLRVRPVTEVYTKDPIFIPAASRPADAKPTPRPQPPRAESEPVKVPVRPVLGHRAMETEGESSKAAKTEIAPRPRSFQAEGESSRAHVRHDLRHPAIAVEEGLRDAAYRDPPSAISSAEADTQRSPSPGIVIPDADMIDLQRARTLRRTRKTSIQRTEDTLAAAVVIYATAEALSPPGSPSPFDHYRDRGLPNLEHQMYTEPSDYNFPVVPTPRRSFEDDYEEFHKSNADLFADDRSRESDSSRSDRDRDGHRRRRHSHHSHRSSGSRGEEDRERRYRDDDERRAHRPRTEDEGRRRRQSLREDESRYSRHRDDSRGEADAKSKSSHGSDEPRTRGYRRDEDVRPRESRKVEEPASRSLPQEDEGRERRRRSSGAHTSRRHRSDTVESAAPPGTPPRTPRRDSGFSADNSSGSSGRKRRTTEEQAAHDKRKADRAERRAREESEARREPSRYREPVPESKGKEPAREPTPEPEPQLEPEPDRRHRRSRRHSHSGRPRHEEPQERPREEPAIPEKKFYPVRKSEGVLGGTPPPREEPAIAEPVRERTRDAPPEGSPKRSSTRHRRTRPSTDEPRPRSSRRPRDEPAPEPPRDKEREKNKEKDRTRDKEPETRPTKHVRMDTEDTRRKARHEERRRAQIKEEDKKPSGIKGAFKKLFSKS
ncbi:uncharacterized protein FTOL_00803 [Fusarium torulosum]|uniref:Uncharacterized protein n=1 Tax=Fusarium torulosum TaxID=33205 RepID=A0AAE8LYU8_9HYPO|nr:uncharacterized protein FTOL_00803 [Fusarium torulosum]